MSYFKTFNEFVNESKSIKIDESVSHAMESYVKKAASNDKVNDVTFDEVLIPLAQHLDSYTGTNMGDLEYTKTTLDLFKKLVDSMAKAHIDGYVDESEVNEARLTGKETQYSNKEFLTYFQQQYSYISPNISSRDLEKWLKQHIIKKVTLAKAADYFQDYILANGLGDVQESKVNEAAGTLRDKYDKLIKALEKAKVPCRVKLTKDEVIIECGWDYPDKISDKVFDAADSVNLKSSEISVSAEHSGPGVIDTRKVNGGPKRY
jgi:hypothetical protein